MLTPEELNQRLNSLEADMNRLVTENERLIRERESVYVEMDSCVALLLRLAAANGFTAGVLNGNQAVLDLESGQVTWEFSPSEAHLFETLSNYPHPLEEIDIPEKYRRIMNPGTLVKK